MCVMLQGRIKKNLALFFSSLQTGVKRLAISPASWKDGDFKEKSHISGQIWHKAVQCRYRQTLTIAGIRDKK